MNRRALLILLIVAVASPVAASEQNLLDFGAFDLKVTSIKEIPSFTGEKGNTVKASRRDARLVEVELTGRANATGEFALYPTMFSALCSYRGVANVIPARAIGTKIKDRMTGEVTEYWYNEQGVSIIIGMSEGETIRRYIILELPKETKDFHVQGPKIIPQ